MANTVDTSRITGMVSGFDTDQMIKDLMEAEQLKLDKVEQEKQLVEWKQDSYRNIISGLESFQDEYLDVINGDTNFRSAQAFSEFSNSVTIDGTTTDYVSVSGSATMSDYSHTISSISQLATAETWTGSIQKSSIDGSGFTLADVNNSITSGNDTFSLSVDGQTEDIQLAGGYATIADATSDLQTKIDAAFGSGIITVSDDGSELSLTPSSGHTVKLIESDVDILGNLGFSNGDKNYIATSGTLADEFGMSTGQSISLTINGVSDFGITTDDTVEEMMNKINSSSAEVEMSYSTLENKFVLKSEDTGVVNSIDLTDTDSFLANQLKITGVTDAAQDAQFTLDGVTTSRSSNNFTIDGVTYQLNETYDGSSGDIDIKFSTDTDAIIDKIKSFVETYNGMITMINEKVEEKRYYDYDPLTDDQKKEMSEDEIDLWEEKAKSGLLRSDTLLQDVTDSMRQQLYEAVEGVDITLSEIGIETSTDFTQRGKLVIDETELEDAINNNLDEVVDLFTKTSDIDYDDGANRTTRLSEEGLGNRLNDIIQDNIRVTRDDDGNKGLLLEKAGKEGDVTQYDNYFYDQIEDFDEEIDEIEEYLIDKETYYYNMFAKMESALSQMQTQASWISSNM